MFKIESAPIYELENLENVLNDIISDNDTLEFIKYELLNKTFSDNFYRLIITFKNN